MSEPIIANLHGEVLRLLADRCGRHFEGIAAGARWAGKRSYLPNRLVSKVQKLDHAYQVQRHITKVSSNLFLCELATALGMNGGVMHNITEGSDHNGEVSAGREEEHYDPLVRGLFDDEPDKISYKGLERGAKEPSAAAVDALLRLECGYVASMQLPIGNQMQYTAKLKSIGEQLDTFAQLVRKESDRLDNIICSMDLAGVDRSIFSALEAHSQRTQEDYEAKIADIDSQLQVVPTNLDNKKERWEELVNLDLQRQRMRLRYRTNTRNFDNQLMSARRVSSWAATESG